MSKLKRGLWTALRWSVYPLFYVFCLLVFFYVTFPWDRVKDRIIAEFAATQTAKPGEAQRLEIGEVSGHWITGVELTGVKLVVPPTAEEIAEAEAAARRAAEEAEEGTAPAQAEDAAGDAADDEGADDGAKAKGKAKGDAAKKKVERGPKELVVLVERATARVQILPLLLGRVQVKVDVEAFGGEITASVPVKGKGGVELSLENVDLGQIPVLKRYVGVPLRGIASGTLSLTRGENGKLSRSVGALDLSIEDAVLGDGKTKIAKLITLPPAKLGKVEIAAEAEGGTLKVSKFGAAGGDLELSAEGQAKIKDKWKGTTLDLYLRFKFADAYRTKDDKTKLLFGEPGSKIPGMIDSQPKIKRAKRGDDSYGIHVYGSLRAPKYEPWTSDEAGGGASKKKTTQASDDDDDDDDAGATTASKRKRPGSKSPSKSGAGARKKSPGAAAEDRPSRVDEPVQEIELQPPPEPPAEVEPPPGDVIEEPLLDAPPGDAPADAPVEEAPPAEEVAPP